MDLFFLSLLLIVSGGILAPILNRHFTAMKGAAVVLISTGCLLGLVDAGIKLFYTGLHEASFTYLNAFSLEFSIDTLSAFFLVSIFFICLLSSIYSFHYMQKSETPLRTSVNYLFFSLLVASMALVVTAGNMIAFLLSWEVMSLSSFFLVVYNYTSLENRQAGRLYFIFSQVGAMLIFTAFGVIYQFTGNFGFADAKTLTDGAKLLVFIFGFIGFGSKAGVFPFHVWLPHAHPAAPSHISAVMSGVMIKTGIYGILRMYAILGLHSAILGNIVLVAGIVSGILGVVYALGQHDLKRLLAYHSVENIGIILMGLGIGMIGVASQNPVMAVMGFAGGLLHVLNHSIFKSLLFMGAGMVLQKTGTRSIDALGGLLKKMKITGTTFLIGSLAISGLPPFNGFVSEFFVYIGAFKGISLTGMPFVLSLLGIVSLAVIGGLALACFTKVLGVVFQGEPRSVAAENVNENGMTMRLPMLILAGACVLIGIFPKVFVLMAVKGISALNLGYGRIPLDGFITLTGHITRASALFVAVMLVILALRTLLYRQKTITSAGTWGCGFTQPSAKMQYTGSSYAASILEFFGPVAPLEEHHPPIKGRFPKPTHYVSHVHDIAEKYLKNVTVYPVMALFDRLRWMQHGDIHLYISYILVAIIVLLFFI